MATKNVVTGDQYRLIDRRMREIKRQLDQAGGSPLDPDDVARTLQRIIEGSNQPPIIIAIGSRMYEVLGFMRQGEKYVTDKAMAKRANEMSAVISEDDIQYIADHQNEIPAVLQGKNLYAFTEDHRPDASEDVYCFHYSKSYDRNGSWTAAMYNIEQKYFKEDRLLRRV